MLVLRGLIPQKASPGKPGKRLKYNLGWKHFATKSAHEANQICGWEYYTCYADCNARPLLIALDEDSYTSLEVIG